MLHKEREKPENVQAQNRNHQTDAKNSSIGKVVELKSCWFVFTFYLGHHVDIKPFAYQADNQKEKG